MTKQTINVGTSPNDNRGDSLRASFQKINANFTELYTALGLDTAPLNLGAFEFVGSVLSTTDSSAIVIDQAVSVTSDLTVGGDIVPNIANGGDLGSLARPWKTLYVSNQTIYLGSVPLSLDANNNLTVNGSPVTGGGGNSSSLVNGSKTVSLGSDGTTTFPTGGQIANYPGGVGASDNSWFVTPGGEPDGSGGVSSQDGQQYIQINNNLSVEIGTSYGTANESIWRFGRDGDLTLPAGGDILDSNGDSVLGGGLSITDFGLGFTDTLDAGKITTSKLYNENPNQGLNNQYTLEVTDGGVVALPDGSIINGATLKTIAGNYAGITAGPNGADEDSWVWVDNNGATIATKYSTDNHTWTFNNNGGLTFPQGTFLGYSDPGGFIIDGAVDKDIAIYTYSGADAHGWTFGEDGDLTLPAGGDILDSEGNSVLGGGSSTVVRQDTPPSADNGTLWFNTLEGRLYIKYSDAWIDAAPLMTPAPDTDIDVASITFPDASVQTTAFTGIAVSDRLVNGVHEVVLGANGTLTVADDIILPQTGRIIKDCNNAGGTTSMRWINIPDDQEVELIRVYTGDPDGEDDVERAQISLEWQTDTQSGLSITAFDDDSGDEYQWEFKGDGTLTLPGGGTITEVGPGAIQITPTGGANEYQALMIYPTAGEGDHIHLTAGGGTTELYLGDDLHYVKLASDGNIRIQADNGVNGAAWTFGTDGKLTVPANSSVLTNETALKIATHSTTTYTFNQAYWEALNGDITRVVTPTGNAQYFSCTVTANQDGTYTVADPTGNSFAPGNWFKVPGNELGGVTPANDIQINIATVDGEGVILTTTITGTAVGKQWQFAADGSLTLPIGVSIDSNVSSLYPKIIADSGKLFSVQGQGSTGSAAMAWSLNPNTDTQYAAVGVNQGGGDNLAKVVLTAGNTTATLKVWKFDETGALTFPDNTVQTTAAESFSFSVAADDSTQRAISKNELVKFIGAGGVTTASDAEGNITITGSKVIGEWAVTTGTNTYSFTVPSNGAYQLWVRGNIPDGIISYIATVHVTNPNVQVLGTQRAWNYTGASSPILLTSLPSQIVGSEGTISTGAILGTTNNVFVFGISNTSGSTQAIYYGYTKIS